MTDIINIQSRLLAKMAPERLVEQLMAMPAAARLEIVLAREDAMEVVGAFPEQDFYIFVKELLADEARSLLALASKEQVNHILDLEAWNRDEIQAGKALLWLSEIVTASDQRFLEWLYNVDFEFLVSLGKKWLEVMIIPDDAEIAEMSDDFPRQTIDDQFYFEIKYPQHEGFIKSILNFLFETHNSFYREFMTQIVHGLDGEIEELAFQFHRGRLADNAIPDAAEAATIYHPIIPQDIQKHKMDKAIIDESHAAPIFAMMLVPHNNLLTEALALIAKNGVRKTLQIEFASLANKIIVADGLAPDVPGNLQQAADKATAYVNLGLDLQCLGDINQAVTLLSTISLEGLFRFGQGKVQAVSNEVKQILNTGWLSRWPGTLNCLDLKWHEQIALLLDNTPMIMRQETADKPAGEDFIRTRADLGQAHDLGATIVALAPIFADLEESSGCDWLLFGSLLWRKGQLNSLHSVTLGNLLFTAAAHKLKLGKWLLTPLPVDQWSDTLPYLAPDSIADLLFKRLDSLISDEDERKLVKAYLVPIIENYRDEMNILDGGVVPEAYLNPFFLFTEKINDKKNNQED